MACSHLNLAPRLCNLADKFKETKAGDLGLWHLGCTGQPGTRWKLPRRRLSDVNIRPCAQGREMQGPAGDRMDTMPIMLLDLIVASRDATEL
jgi:hypothetical protein